MEELFTSTHSESTSQQVASARRACADQAKPGHQQTNHHPSVMGPSPHDRNQPSTKLKKAIKSMKLKHPPLFREQVRPT